MKNRNKNRDSLITLNTFMNKRIDLPIFIALSVCRCLRLLTLTIELLPVSKSKFNLAISLITLVMLNATTNTGSMGSPTLLRKNHRCRRVSVLQTSSMMLSNFIILRYHPIYRQHLIYKYIASKWIFAFVTFVSNDVHR